LIWSPAARGTKSASISFAGQARVTPFDIFVLVVIGLSALFALSRGFVTELLSLGAWLGAFLAVRFLFPTAQGWTRGWFDSEVMADVTALLLLFFGTLFLLRALATMAGGRVKESALGFADRTLGALFGAIRGLFIVAFAYLLLAFIIPGDKMPSWIVDAKSHGMVAFSADMLSGVSQVLKARATGEEPGPSPLLPDGISPDDLPPGHPLLGPGQGEDGYTDQERRDLEKLLDSQEKTDI
jgi:membrane protein required for colicin V production